MVGKCIFLLLGVFLVVYSAEPNAKSAFECPRDIWNGVKFGRFVGVMEADKWSKMTNYLFKPSNKYTVGCVQLDESKYPTRAKLVFDALNSGKEVSILVTGEHQLAGIALGQ